MTLVPQVYAQGNTITIPRPEGFNITDIGKLVSAAIGLALIIAAVLVFAYLIWGGIQYITSGGDKGKTEEARARISSALVGLAIVAAAWAVIQIVGYFFGIDIFKGNVPIPQPF